MRIVLFSHPSWLPGGSMPRFVDMILQGGNARGDEIAVWQPAPHFHRLPCSSRLKKYLGYLDQYVVFPLQVRLRLREADESTLFVFADQALGPWVPLVANRPHVIHVHDFIALRSALGEFTENPTGWTGRQYQAMIRRGFVRGQHFISVSENTQADLHRFLPGPARISEVVYNGLNFPFRPMDGTDCARVLAEVGLDLPDPGYLLHVGGNGWYKNRLGVLEIYAAYVERTMSPLPLWMIGLAPTSAIRARAERICSRGEVRFLMGVTDEQVRAAYSSASLLVFPSHAEGFGWPIAEAMACGCLVLTTDAAPMTEVGGAAAFYLPPQTNNLAAWAASAAQTLSSILDLPPDVRKSRRKLGLAQSTRFETPAAIDSYWNIYLKIIKGTQGSCREEDEGRRP